MARKRKKCKTCKRKKTALKYSDVELQLKRSASGRAALSRFRRFWGLKGVPTIKIYTGGSKKVLVGLGRSPALNVANGSNERRATKKSRRRHKGVLATDARGKRMWIIRSPKGLPEKPVLKFVGWSPATEYVPSVDIEKSGTHKK